MRVVEQRHSREPSERQIRHDDQPPLLSGHGRVDGGGDAEQGGGPAQRQLTPARGDRLEIVEKRHRGAQVLKADVRRAGELRTALV